MMAAAYQGSIGHTASAIYGAIPAYGPGGWPYWS